MSEWSFVSGVIQVETLADSDAEAMYIAQTVVNHLPKIDCLDGGAQFYLNKPKWNNTSSNADEFGNRSNLMRGINNSGLFEWQSMILITVNGALRGVEFNQALHDTTKMLSRLSSQLRVTDCLVAVSSYGRQFVFCNPKWVLEREITDWARGLLREHRKQQI